MIGTREDNRGATTHASVTRVSIIKPKINVIIPEIIETSSPLLKSFSNLDTN